MARHRAHRPSGPCAAACAVSGLRKIRLEGNRCRARSDLGARRASECARRLASKGGEECAFGLREFTSSKCGSRAARLPNTATRGAVVRAWSASRGVRSSLRLTRPPMGPAASRIARAFIRSSQDTRRVRTFGGSSRGRKPTYLQHIAKIETDFGDLPLAALEDARVTRDFLEWRDSMVHSP